MFRKLGFATAFLLAGLGAAQAGVISATVVDESSQLGGRPASNLVSGVGFGVTPGSFSIDPSLMWLTATSGGNQNNAPFSPGDYVTFQFSQPVALSSLKIWQYNENSGAPAIELARGVSTGLVQTSSDGLSFSTVALLNLAEGSGDMVTDVSTTISLSATATYVRLANLVSFAGANNYVGLSQVQFSTADVPEPMSLSLLVVGVAGVWFTRRSLAG